MRLTGPTTAIAAVLLAVPGLAGAFQIDDRSHFVGELRYDLLVGFQGAVDAGLLAKHGASVVRVMNDIHVAQVRVTDVASFTAAMLASGAVSYVEPNDRIFPAETRLDGTRWDGSRWDGSRWDSTSSDGSRWDGSTWDASRWDGSRWDASRWDGSRWDGSTWDASRWDATWWSDGFGAMDPGVPSQWGLRAVHAGEAWQLTMGDPRVTVCVLDTGVDATHDDLRSALRPNVDGTYGYNAMKRQNGAFDEDGHGTHVTGIIAATAGNGLGVAGLAQVHILPVKVLNATAGTEADLADGLLHCMAQGARVASMSLHVTEQSRTLERAADAAQRKGVLLVAAAGNGASSTIPAPAAYPGVLAVGAAMPDGYRANFSNYGPSLDILAPGYLIASTLPGDRYAMGTGTSQATPFVAAAAALVWSLAPGLHAGDVQTALRMGANDVYAQGHDGDSGAGLLNAWRALQHAAAIAPKPPASVNSV